MAYTLDVGLFDVILNVRKMLRHFTIAAQILLLVVSVLHYGNGSRILGIFPTASISHQVVFRALTLALNKRGHELVVLTTDPVNDPTLKNYTEIDIHFLYKYKFDDNFINTRGMTKDWVNFFADIAPLIHTETEEILSYPDLRKLYEPNSNEKFDLMMIETLFWPAFLPLSKRFDVPIVGITSMGLTINSQYAIGKPIMPSHPATWEMLNGKSGPLTFWRRLDNFIQVWKYIYYYTTIFMPTQEAIAAKHFGKENANLAEIEKNVNVIFVNQQEPISFIEPNLPGVIRIGGFHVSKRTQSLPKDLQKMLDEATQGFIYMSLGTNAKSNMLSQEARGEFIAAFAKLPYKVIWKFEDDAFPGKPDNVFLMKWTPQQAILAHPNLKAFVYQGGLQSTEEAVSHAVPLIGIPIMGDQDMQVDKMVSLGVARRLEITAINRDDLLEAILNVTLDGSYKERMLNLRSLINDKPYDPLENAIWWTEYVIRHKGARHLRSSTADEAWYSRQDIDVIAFISAGSALVLILILVILYELVKTIYYPTVKLQVTKKKIN